MSLLRWWRLWCWCGDVSAARTAAVAAGKTANATLVPTAKTTTRTVPAIRVGKIKIDYQKYVGDTEKYMENS